MVAPFVACRGAEEYALIAKIGDDEDEAGVVPTPPLTNINGTMVLPTLARTANLLATQTE